MKVVNGCWVVPVSNAKTHRGYRNVEVQGGRFRAHVVSYVAHRGQIPDGLVLDHLCRVRNCVNPAHLEPVTNRENILRGDSPSAQNARKTRCIRGHELSGENLYQKPDGNRQCRECQRMHDRKARPPKGTGPGRKRIDIDITEARRLRESGLTFKQVANKMGLSVTMVYGRLR